MGAESLPIRIEELLEHAGWVRALARSLVADAGVADDLVQETWLAALRRPPEDRRNLRGWLGRVLTHAARKHARRSPARALAGDPTAADGPPEALAEALESQQALVRLVLELDEPYRSTVILRYWHDLDSARIARRQGVPAGTVRWRLKEGLDRLRGRLDATHGGDRRAWCLALAPLLRRGAGAGPGAAALPALWKGILGMPLVLKLSVTATVLALALLALRAVRVEPLAPTARMSTPVPIAARAAGAPARPAPDAQARRALEPPAAGGSDAAPAPVASARPRGRVTARVLGADGRPLAGATAETAEPMSASATSDAAGELLLDLELPRGDTPVTLQVLAPAHAVRAVELVARPGQTVELGDLRLEPGGDVSGRVLGPDGQPVREASITYESGRPPAGSLDRARREHSAQGGWWRAPRSDAQGRFTLRGVPVGEGHLWANREGLLAAPSSGFVVQAGAAIGEVEITLGELPREDVIAGRVLDGNGEPVPFAPVFFRYEGWFSSGSHLTTTDAEGRFSELCDRGGARHVRARDPRGHWSDVVLEGVRPGTTDLVLRLGAPRPLELIVRDADGRALAAPSAHLWDTDRRDLLGPDETPEADPQGLLTLSAPSTPFVIVVSAPGHEERVLGPYDPEALPQRVECALAALPGVRGLVRAGGEPVPGAQVEIAPAADGHAEQDGFPVRVVHDGAIHAVADEEGRFVATLRAGGTFFVRIEAPGWAACERGPLAIDPARGLDLGPLELEPGGALEGRVLPADGRSPAGRIVGISRGDGHARTQRVGADGGFRFEHLIPGPWQVELRQEELDPRGSSSSQDSLRPLATVPSNCLVRAGATTVFDIGPGDHERCVLTGALQVDGAPARAWDVRLLDPAARVVSGEPEAVSDADGRFRLSRATPGEPWLSLRHGDLTLLCRIDLAPGTTDWSADIQRATLDVDGLDPWPDDRAPAALHVWSRGGLVAVTLLYPDAEGRVSGLRVPAGPGRLVRADPLAPADPGTLLALPALLELELEPGTHARVRVP